MVFLERPNNPGRGTGPCRFIGRLSKHHRCLQTIRKLIAPCAVLVFCAFALISGADSGLPMPTVTQATNVSQLGTLVSEQHGILCQVRLQGVLLECEAGCSFGWFAPPKPLDIRAARERSNAGLADKAGPVGKSIRRTRQPPWQVAEQIRPGLRLRHETRRQGGDVEQDRFNPFHHREPGESRRVGAR